MSVDTRTSASVSKGVFVYKGGKPFAKPEVYIGLSAKQDGDHGRVERMHIYDGLWKEVSARIESLQSSLNNKVFGELLSYIESATSTGLQDSRKMSSEITTAALVTGVNVPDHAEMFSCLKSMIHDRITSHVVSLHSTNCQNIKAVIACTAAQLISNSTTLVDENDNEDDLGDFASFRAVKKLSSNTNMFDISSWYKDTYQNQNSADSSDNLKLQLHLPAKRKASTITPKSTPRKRLMSSSTIELSSPTKCPPSPGSSSRAGLRSTTPNKLPPADSTDKRSPATVSKKLDASFTSLKSPLSKLNVAEKKEKSLERTRPPIVIIFEDFESFNGVVLQDFITICGYHLNELPVVLIFGIATTINVVHRLLPHRVTSLLSMEKFQVPLSSEYLSLILQQVLLNNDFPFKLGPKVFAFLLDIFLFHNFSVISFIRSYRYAMMQHFYSNKVSFLCQSLESAQKTASSLTPSQLSAVRSCDSVKRFHDELPKAEQISFFKDEKLAKEEVAGFLADLDEYSVSFFPVMSCLHTLTCKLPTSPLGKQLRELYATCLAEDVYETRGYEQALALLRTMSRDELVRLLSELVDLLSSLKLPLEINHIYQQMVEFRNKFEHFEEINPVLSEEKEIAESSLLPKKTNIYELRQKLKEMEKKHKGRNTTAYDKLRNEAIDFCDCVFRQYLRCPKSLPLYEAMYFDDVAELKRHLFPSIRLAVQTALGDPYQYLKIDSLNIGDGQISPEMPDICIVYKLHMECGHLINIYDWLMSFATVLHSVDETVFDKGGKPSKVVQARFTRAVSELQFMGFIRSTKRKAEHMERLTWGPC